MASLSASSRREDTSVATRGVFTAAVIVAAFLSLLVAAEFAGSLASFPANRDAASVAEDLVAFHRAGEMALQGDAPGSYDPAALRAGLASHQQGLLWLNPPHALLLIAPFAALPYGAAKAIWLALTVAAFAFVLRLAKVRGPAACAAALLSPAMLIAAMLLQLGAFIAAGLAAALLLAPKRPILAGILLALLTMKPQYGLMAPVFLIATGQWRTILAAVVATAVLIALSVAAFGLETWAAFFESLKTVHEPFSRQLLEGTATFGQTAGKLGAGDAARAAAQVAGIGACGVLTWFAARRLDRAHAIGLMLLASLAAAPSAWIYDWAFVVAGLAFIAGRAPHPKIRRRIFDLPPRGRWVSLRALCFKLRDSCAARPRLPLGGRPKIASSAIFGWGSLSWPLPLQTAAALAWLAPLAPTFSDSPVSGLAAPFALYALILAAAAALFGRSIKARPAAPSSA